jgi:hypothetical protein
MEWLLYRSTVCCVYGEGSWDENVFHKDYPTPNDSCSKIKNLSWENMGLICQIHKLINKRNETNHHDFNEGRFLLQFTEYDETNEYYKLIIWFTSQLLRWQGKIIIYNSLTNGRWYWNGIKISELEIMALDRIDVEIW